MAARWDLVLVGLAAVHAVAVIAMPSVALVAFGVWWNSNTIAHNFIHRPFFRSRSLNLLFAAGQSVLIGVPQTLWRERHLAHHAGVDWRPRLSLRLACEAALIVALWVALGVNAPLLFATIYLPGYLAGLALCAIQGHYEHAGATISHYGRVYNWLCFNDGYHVEHHAYPGVHWTTLPGRVEAGANVSRWPALLRWLDGFAAMSRSLDVLEHLVLRSHVLQRFVLAVHRRAFRALLADGPTVRRVAIVGGGLFPRTALVLRDLLPAAEITVIEANSTHVDTARHLLDAKARVTFEHAWFESAGDTRNADLVVIPLAFRGNRAEIYRHPPAPRVIVHDWIWRRRGEGRVISIALLKRLNLVRAA